MPPGSTINVTAPATPGLNATGASGQITANGVTVNLGTGAAAASNLIGGIAQGGASVILGVNGATATNITTLSTGAGDGQRGLVSSGTGSSVSGDGITLTIGRVATASNNIGALVQGGGAFSLRNTTITMRGGVNGLSNYGVMATGAGSTIDFINSSISTLSRGSFGVRAESGGIANLRNAIVSTTGAVTTGGAPVASHALSADGAGSAINATGSTINTASTSAAGAKAENGAQISLFSSTINTSGAGTTTDPAAGAMAVSGASVTLDGSTINTSGQFGHGLVVRDAGSRATMTNSSATVNALRSNGVSVQSGGAVTLTGSTLLVNGAIGVLAEGAGTTFDMRNSQVTTTGATGYGVRGLTGSTLNLTGGSVTTGGVNAAALSLGSSTITANNVTILTTGNGNSFGALADGSGVLTLNGGTVTTTGQGSSADGRRPHGLVGRNPGGVLNASNTTVLTTGAEGMGAVADDGGSVSFNGGSITTQGRLAIGLFSVVEQAGSQFVADITVNNAAITTSGEIAYGALAQRNFLDATATITLGNSSVSTSGNAAVGLRAVSAGTITANQSTVTTTGLAAHGALARDNGSSVTMNSTVVSTSGTNAHGSVAQNGGRLAGTGANVTASGANAAALYAAGDTAGVSSASFTDSTLTNSSGPTIGVGGTANVTLTGVTVSGSGTWLRVATTSDFPLLAAPEVPLLGPPDEGVTPTPLATPPGLGAAPGLATLVISRSTLIGAALTDAGSTSNVTLQDSTRWTLTGNSNLTNLTLSSSLIDFSAPAGGAFKTLTVRNFTGNGGMIKLNTYLGADDSPSDRLVISGGTATGNTQLRIANAGGPGARTTGNGIMVVDATAGTTAAGSFRLAGPVVAGPYEYALLRGSTDTSSPESWYLRSTGGFRPETSLYAALPAVAILYGGKLLDTLDERWGEENPWQGLDETGAAAGDTGQDKRKLVDGAWGRLIGQHGRRRGEAQGFSGGPSYEHDFYAVQAGLDLHRSEDAEGKRVHAGLYGAIGHGRGRVQHSNGDSAGENNFHAYSIGGYWTRFWPKNGYLDAIAQVTWYDARGDSKRGLAELKTRGMGYALSLEGGYPYQLGRGWLLEPQAQLIYGRLNLKDGADDGGNVSFRDGDTLVGRLGLRLGRSRAKGEDEQSRRTTGWLRLSLLHEFFGQPKAEFSTANGTVSFPAGLGGNWWELKAGFTRQLKPSTFLYASIGFQRSFDGDRYAYDGKIGLRFSF